MLNGNYILKKTKTTPVVVLNQNKGVIKLTGNCIPIDAGEFFDPIFKWAINYSYNPQPVTLLFFDLNIIQGASQKYLAGFLEIFIRIRKNGLHVFLFVIINDTSDETTLDFYESINSWTKLPMHVFDLGTFLSRDQELLEKIKNELKISKISKKVIEQFNHVIGICVFEKEILTELHLFGLSSMNLPQIIYELKDLKVLSIEETQISIIPKGISKLKNLKSLKISSNKNLKILSKEILDLNLKFTNREDSIGLYISENQLESPPIEIIRRGRSAVTAYYQSLEEDVKMLMNELKVVLVGEGASGKTSLVKRLLNERFNIHESQTHGILLKKWNIQINGVTITLNTWDFGGQEIMHATHQFFLTKRCIYLLVIDCRKDEKTENWLKLLSSFGKEAPVIVIINKIDENTGFELDYNYLISKYSNIKGFYKVSCLTNLGIEELKAAIFKEVGRNELIRIRWSYKWLKLKNELQNKNYQFINEGEFSRLCSLHEISKMNEIIILTDLLNDLGIIVHFSDFELSDTFIIDPIWITSAIYTIINSPVLSENKGILELSRLSEIFALGKKSIYHYPTSSYVYIINLMKKFELCYSISDSSVLIPDLLPMQSKNDKFNKTYDFKLYLQYDFLPRSIIPRLIVKMHNDIRDNIEVWRTGVELLDKESDCAALIYADYLDNRINLSLLGNNIRDYLTILLFTFKNINRLHRDITYKIMIPMPDNSKIVVSYEHLLFLYNEKRQKSYIPDGSKQEYDIEKLLGKFHKDRNTTKDVEEIVSRLLKNSPKESTMDTINEIIIFRPNFMGIGLDINKLLLLMKKKFKIKRT